MDQHKLINKAFQELSDRLVPSDEYLSKGKMAANKIFSLLKGKSRFSLDRVSIGGSTGKKTAIINSDIDCVVFVNIDNILAIESVLDDFEDVLLIAHLPKLTKMWKTRFSLQFNYDGFDIDMLPAINLTKSSDLAPNSKIHSEQAFKVLETIYNNKENAYHYSSALVETQISFMRKQSTFVHALVRLCKLWNASLLIEEYISGRSTLIELIAIFSGQQEEKNTCFEERLFLLNGFSRFLRLMQNFNSLKIEFDFDPLAPQRSVHNFSWLKENAELKKHTPFVIEPANPFNNLAQNVKAAQVKLFQSYASETLRRLDVYVFTPMFTLMPLNVIFEPQPIVHCLISEEIKRFLQSVSFLVSTRVNEGPLSATMTIRNEGKYKTRDMQLLLKRLQLVFSITAQGFVSSERLNQSKNADELRSDLKDTIQTYIDVGVLGMKPRSWSKSTEKHEDQDITLSIPSFVTINCTVERFCVFISWSSV